MHRIDGFGAAAGNLWTKGDPSTSTPATHWTPEWANDSAQEEIANFIESRSIALDKLDDTQLDEALDDILLDVDLHPRPNLLRNGGFEVHQFSVSTTQGTQSALSSILAGPDGWRFDTGSGTPSTRIDVHEHAVGQSAVPNGGLKYLEWTQQVAGSGADQYLETRTEDLFALSGVEVTFSVYAQLAAGSTDIELQCIQNFGSGGSAPVTTSLGTKTLTGGWALHEGTATLPSISGKTIGSRPYLAWRIRFTNDTGTFTVNLDNAKAEIAPAATPYPHVPIALLQHRCDRYFLTTYNLPTEAGDQILPITTEAGRMAAHQLVLNGTGFVENLQVEFRQPMHHEPELTWVEPQSQVSNTIEFPDGSQESVTNAEVSQRQSGYPVITSPPANTDDVAHAHFWASAEIGEADGAG